MQKNARRAKRLEADIRQNRPPLPRLLPVPRPRRLRTDSAAGIYPRRPPVHGNAKLVGLRTKIQPLKNACRARHPETKPEQILLSLIPLPSHLQRVLLLLQRRPALAGIYRHPHLARGNAPCAVFKIRTPTHANALRAKLIANLPIKYPECRHASGSLTSSSIIPSWPRCLFLFVEELRYIL